jgi:hypothetical protein
MNGNRSLSMVSIVDCKSLETTHCVILIWDCWGGYFLFNAEDFGWLERILTCLQCCQNDPHRNAVFIST